MNLFEMARKSFGQGNTPAPAVTRCPICLDEVGFTGQSIEWCEDCFQAAQRRKDEDERRSGSPTGAVQD